MFLKKIKAHRVFVLLFLFFLSRIIFITTEPVMFDSQEYINRFSEPNLLTAVISGHIPYHAGYIIFFWPIFQLAKILDLNSLYIILFFQSILATLSIYFFYKTIKILTDGKTAFLSAIIASLIPIYWIANVTLMMETVYVTFFIFSVYLLVDYLKKDNRSSLILSSVFFGFSFLAQFSLILWMPFIVFLGVRPYTCPS
jgi:4-amino-4-deoxy-L-arabinose transferase-like glycosyltransferase